MAKKKKVDLEEDFDAEIAEEEELVEEDASEETAEEVAEEEDALAIADDEAVEEAAEDKADDEGVVDDDAVVDDEAVVDDDAAALEPDAEEPEEEEEPRPRGRNTGLTIVLCLLNVMAALGFTFLLVMVYQKRQEWSYAVFLNEFFMMGLPLKEEDETQSASRATLPRIKLDTDQLNKIASLRGVKGGGEFWAVDEPFTSRIQATELTDEVLKDYFGSLGAEVRTLEEEIERLKVKVPQDIAQVGADAVASLKGKDDVTKRQFASKILLPLAYNIYQVTALDKKIKAAQGAALDALIDEACQRRLLVDILAPCEIYRPGDAPFLDKVADLDSFKLDQLKLLLDKRFKVAIADKYDGSVHLGKEWDGQERHSWEKRQAIGFLLVAIASVQKPDFTQPSRTVPLYPDGAGGGTPNLLRAQTVLGLYEFAAAAQNLPIAWNTLTERVLQSIHVDREGFDILFKDKDGKERPERNQAFVDKHEMEIRRILDLTMEIKKAEDRLKDLQGQHKDVKKIYEDRAEHFELMKTKLLSARKETAKQVAELRVLQGQLYRAQVELRDAADRNFRLHAEIKAEERKAKGLKGTDQP